MHGWTTDGAGWVAWVASRMERQCGGRGRTLYYASQGAAALAALSFRSAHRPFDADSLQRVEGFARLEKTAPGRG